MFAQPPCGSPGRMNAGSSFRFSLQSRVSSLLSSLTCEVIRCSRYFPFWTSTNIRFHSHIVLLAEQCSSRSARSRTAIHWKVVSSVLISSSWLSSFHLFSLISNPTKVILQRLSLNEVLKQTWFRKRKREFILELQWLHSDFTNS